jgi:hypothetical protein
LDVASLLDVPMRAVARRLVLAAHEHKNVMERLSPPSVLELERALNAPARRSRAQVSTSQRAPHPPSPA